MDGDLPVDIELESHRGQPTVLAAVGTLGAFENETVPAANNRPPNSQCGLIDVDIDVAAE